MNKFSDNSLQKHIHIICLDIPYPADYGGMFDLFYKLPALHKAGIKIYLHCWKKDRAEQPALNEYCEEVHYYTRSSFSKGWGSGLPHIVASRSSDVLINRLLQDDHPILMEGVHCTAPVWDKRLNARKKMVRMHNVEQQYYDYLFRYASNIFRKIYYRREASLLKKYEQSLAGKVDALLAVTPADAGFYRTALFAEHAYFLPLFLPAWTVNAQPGMGTYCLYHANLGVDENEYTAAWLLKNVFNECGVPLVIAGKNPSAKLQRLAHRHTHTCLVADPSEEQMQDMILKAHLHILPSFSQSGIKLKLINALYNGRHCIVNDDMVAGTKFSSLCHIANTPEAMREIVAQIFHQPFTEDEIQMRKHVLQDEFNNDANAQQMINWIWGE